jgi:hypothetical protein
VKPDAVRSNFEVTARRSRVAAGRRKGQRNLVPVLREVLRQTVTVKMAKAQRMSKSEALIQMLLSKAHNGDRRAINAMLWIEAPKGGSRMVNPSLASCVFDPMCRVSNDCRSRRGAGLLRSERL